MYKLEELGLLLQQRLALRCVGRATGDMLSVVVDGLALYHAMEADEALLSGADGTRAIGCTTALLAIGANDVNRGLYGIGYKSLYEAFFSKRFQTFVREQSAERGGVVTILVPAGGDADIEEVQSCTFKLEYHAVAALL